MTLKSGKPFDTVGSLSMFIPLFAGFQKHPGGRLFGISAIKKVVQNHQRFFEIGVITPL